LITIDELKFLIEEIGFKQIHCCNTLPVKEGGLSGKTLRPYVNKLINIIRDNWGDSIEIIAGGGVENIQHVDDYLTLGADHISLGTICFTPWRVKALINKRD
jgi:dihydroorotate dehydrogenase